MSNKLLTILLLVHIAMTSIGNLGQQGMINEVVEIQHHQAKAVDINQDAVILLLERSKEHGELINFNQRAINLLLTEEAKNN